MTKTPPLTKLGICFILFLVISNGNTVLAQVSGFKTITTNIGVTNNGTNCSILQPDNKTINCGFVQEGDKYQIAFYRLDSNGIADGSFGNNGVSLFYNFLPNTYQGASIRSVALQADGKIVAAGTAWYQSGSYFLSNILVMRLNRNGTIDSSFGEGGTVRTNIYSVNNLSVDDAFAIKVLTNGTILIGGTSYDYAQHRMVFVEYKSNGAINTSFGSGGAVLIDINHRDDEIFDMAVQPDGNIIGAGEYFNVNSSYDVAVVRLLSNGALDNSFGTNGIVTTRIGAGGDVAKSVALQSNGKIVIAGSTRTTTQAKDDILSIRYNQNGTIDSSFALNGIYIKDIDGDNDVANSVKIQPDNKIILGGYATLNGVNNFLSLRLKNSGTPDIPYGSNGMVTTSIFSQGDAANAMILQADGKIIEAGQSTNGASTFFSSIRYNTNGSLDDSYSNDGIHVFSIGNSNDKAGKMVKLPWNNTLLLCGSANDYWALANYNVSSLSLNKNFGVNGVQTFRYSDQYSSTTPEVAVDSALQKIYLCGETDQYGFIMIRLNRNGSLDTTFGTRGVVKYFMSIYYGGLAVLPNHKIITGGLQQGSTNYTFLARFNANGTIDSSFGTNGLVKNLAVTPNSIMYDKYRNRILSGGYMFISFSGSGVGVMAIKNGGVIDSSFGTNGVGGKAIPNGSSQVYFRYRLAQDNYGRILISGGVARSGYNFSVTRFLANGSPDANFGNGGVVVTQTAKGSYYDTYNEGIASGCNMNSCSVVTTGIEMNDANEKSKIAIIVYDNKGNIDSIP
ncbi:MAG TPA: hypothetical protein VEV83_14050, partial [Parafilimonas sp.]|nr:hypothetical protein [Parafilimonas sp.]